jgi:hypothetical protein
MNYDWARYNFVPKIYFNDSYWRYSTDGPGTYNNLFEPMVHEAWVLIFMKVNMELIGM